MLDYQNGDLDVFKRAYFNLFRDDLQENDTYFDFSWQVYFLNLLIKKKLFSNLD